MSTGGRPPKTAARQPRLPGDKVRTRASRAVIRRLGIGERERIRDHLLRLEGEDRLLRFGGHASDVHIAAYSERLDLSRLLDAQRKPALIR
ncbi:MAG TPA: hypothetical protein VFZ10_01930 [Geminicoccaceae bacterium]